MDPRAALKQIARLIDDLEHRWDALDSKQLSPADRKLRDELRERLSVIT